MTMQQFKVAVIPACRRQHRQSPRAIDVTSRPTCTALGLAMIVICLLPSTVCATSDGNHNLRSVVFRERRRAGAAGSDHAPFTVLNEENEQPDKQETAEDHRPLTFSVLGLCVAIILGCIYYHERHERFEIGSCWFLFCCFGGVPGICYALVTCPNGWNEHERREFEREDWWLGKCWGWWRRRREAAQAVHERPRVDHSSAYRAEDESKRQHVSMVVCGHVDAGKSTTAGRLIFELGGIAEREMEKLHAEAKALGKESCAFAFFMDRQKDERTHGVTIACTSKDFCTDNYHYTIIDAPGHRDFIKNMITGASQADVALIMVPADATFTATVAKGNHRAGEVQGQTRQHARLVNLLGVKQVIVGVNKMDCDVAKYGEQRYQEISNEVKNVLAKVGFKRSFVAGSIPILPISGQYGDNLLAPSDNMKWWRGVEVETTVGDKRKVKVHTLLDALNNMVQPPVRDFKKVMRMPLSGVYKIKGVGDVLTGRVEQGVVKPGDEVVFPPTHIVSTTGTRGKVLAVEMHHKSVPKAGAGDIVGVEIGGLQKGNMPQVGHVMILASDNSLKPVKRFTAQVQILDHPGQLKVGYTPIAFVRTGRSAVRMSTINWKIGKETGGKKAEGPVYVKNNEVAEVVFEPQQPFVVDSFKNCEGLGRVAIMEGNGIVMLGKIIKAEFQDWASTMP